MLKVTMPSSRSGAASDYWIDGSNKETLADYYELESELGRWSTTETQNLLITILPSWAVELKELSLVMREVYGKKFMAFTTHGTIMQ
ncbi:KCC4 kinase, partial [Polypterus senegalus]